MVTRKSRWRMVRVCDAIMGTGKSSAAITYINEHPDYKFIYITPYLEEAARIKQHCPAADFVEPSDKLKKFDFKKSVHTAHLIREGRNIATTHQAFRGYTQDTLQVIKDQGYTLIIDENVEILEEFNIHPDDLKMAVDAGYINDDNGTFSIANENYEGVALKELFYIMKSRNLVRIVDENENVLYYWALPPDLVTSFRDVFILTYLFDGQSLHHFLKIYDIPYKYIGIEKHSDGSFSFCDYPGYTPEYVYNMKEMIHIVSKEKLNDIGDDYYALSKSWFDRGGDDVEQLKKDVHNCYTNLWAGIPVSRRLWGTFKCAYTKIRGKGYTNSFLTFNAKATNKYRECDYLVYITNVFMNVREKVFYNMHGIEVDEDKYALSIMVQWLWRSAIRDGKEIYVYIPSRRMRTLLINWINSFNNGGEPIG